MNKIILSLAGTVTVLASAIALIDFKRRRDCRLIVEPPTEELFFALLTATSGAMMAAVADQLDETKHPERADDLQRLDKEMTAFCLSKSKIDKKA